MRKGLFGVTALVLACMIGWGSAAAQSYPTRQVTLVVPFAPGGKTDILGPLVAQGLTEEIGQTVVVDNRAGAGAALGSAYVARANPDGYTLVLSNAASHGTGPSIQDAPYDAEKDFAHIALIGVIPQYFVVSPEVPAKTIKEFVTLAQGSPGKLNLGTAGNGSIGHFAGALFANLANIDIVQVPYNGTAPATQDLLAGRVQAMFQNAPEAISLVKSGKLRLLAVTAEQRVKEFPDVPTFREGGMPTFVNYTWYGVSAPRGTPAEIVNKLNAAVRKVLARPVTQTRMTELAVDARNTSPEEYTTFVRDELAKFKRIATEAGIKG